MALPLLPAVAFRSERPLGFCSVLPLCWGVPMDVRYRDRSLTIEIEAFGQALAPSGVRSQGVDII